MSRKYQGKVRHKGDDSYQIDYEPSSTTKGVGIYHYANGDIYEASYSAGRVPRAHPFSPLFV